METKLKEGYLASIIRRDPAARSAWSVFWLYPSVIALRWYHVSHFLWKIHFKFLAEMIMHHARKTTGIEIHPAAKIGHNLFIDHGNGVVIGETAEIGDNVTMYHGVTLGGVSMQKIKRHPTIGDDVLIGTGTAILGAITIGKGAKIGANLVIRHDIEPNSIVIGGSDNRIFKNGDKDNEHQS